MDCPPNLGQVTINALNCSDYVLVPVQTEPMAALGVPMLIDNTLTKVRRRVNPGVEVLGILPTMYAERHSMDRLTLAQLHDLYGAKTRIFSPVPSSTQYPQGSAAGRPDPGSDPRGARRPKLSGSRGRAHRTARQA